MNPKSTEIKSLENKSGLLTMLFDTNEPFDIEGIPLKLYFVMAALAIAILQLELLTKVGIAGAFAVMWSVGFFFFAIGERVKALRAILGGGLVMSYVGAAVTANIGVITPENIEYLQSFVIGNRLFYFILAGLLISSILSVRPTVLKKALLSFAPIILGGLFLAALGGMLAGFLAGIPLERVVLMYFLPIMGGGTGAGAIPISEVYADVTGESATDYFNFAIAVLTLGNIVAIFIASLLRIAGEKFPAISGDGKLVKGEKQKVEDAEISSAVAVNTHAAMVFVVCLLLAGYVLSATIGLVHFFAWVTIIAVMLNVSRAISPAMQQSLLLLSSWGVKAFLVTILVSFGFSADLDVIAQLFSPGNLFVIVSIVVGAAIGAGIIAHVVRCYPIEGALAGGLCMANAGGSGDLQVLSAARRLELYPYAQLSSRLGGAFMLVLANFLFERIY